MMNGMDVGQLYRTIDGCEVSKTPQRSCRANHLAINARDSAGLSCGT